MKTHYIIPIFVPFAGCSNKCVFCNQNRISGAEGIPEEYEVIETINSYLKTIPNSEDIIIEVAYYGGSFTGLPFEIQKRLLKPAYEAKSKGNIKYIRLSTRSDYINDQVLKLLKDFKVDIIELGVQSLNNEVLRLSKRGHDSAAVIKAIEKIKAAGFKIGVQLMMGLPGDSKAYFYETIEQVISLKPDFVRLYPTLVIEGTELANLYKNGDYKPMSLNESIEFSKIALNKFNENKIPVIRIGLQPTDEINFEKVLAGPFHPAFRELVEADIIKDKINNEVQGIINSNKLSKDKRNHDKLILTLEINPKDQSIVRGQKNKNINFFNKEYPNISLVIKENKAIHRGSIKLNF